MFIAGGITIAAIVTIIKIRIRTKMRSRRSRSVRVSGCYRTGLIEANSKPEAGRER